MIESHPAHTESFTWLQKIKSNEHTGLIAAHSLAEIYAVLTALKVSPRITPAVAKRPLQENIVDALLMRAAHNASVDQVVTLNEKDFRRVYPALADKKAS